MKTADPALLDKIRNEYYPVEFKNDFFGEDVNKWLQKTPQKSVYLWENKVWFQDEEDRLLFVLTWFKD